MTIPRFEDPLHTDALFDVTAPPPITLADKFVIPPMSVLDRRNGDWRERRSKWLALGIKSEVGRARETGAYATLSDPKRADFLGRLLRGEIEKNTIQKAGGISVFDPVVCELVYRWFCPEQGNILDPFAGGSVRGIVASHLKRHYTGIDVREDQVTANIEQMPIANADYRPMWLWADSAELDLMYPEASYDLIFTCPPYGDLEVYSDDPRDLSNMGGYDQFLPAYQSIIEQSARLLKPDRFAAIVVADFRDKRGFYQGFVADTIRAFEAAGCRLYNDAVILDPIGTAAIRAERQFVATRKLVKVHQNLLVFVKGDPKWATYDCGGGLKRSEAEAADQEEYRQ